MNYPLVSIIMASFNRAYLIRETLDSIQQLSFSNWECLIVDDGSTDNTKGELKDFLATDQRFKFFDRTTKYAKGPSGCRNQGIDLASGDFIIFIDSDDIPHPDVLNICLEQINKSKELKFCRFNKKPFQDYWRPLNFDSSRDFSSEYVDLKKIEAVVKNELAFACCTVMWKREAIGNHRFDEKLNYAEEWEYYIRLLSRGIKGISINKILYYNRKHKSSNTGKFWSNNKEMRNSNVHAIKKVLKLLEKQHLLTDSLIHYFLRLGFFLNNQKMIDKVLKHSNYGFVKKMSYKIGYRIYPLLRPIFYIKGKILKA